MYTYERGIAFAIQFLLSSVLPYRRLFVLMCEADFIETVEILFIYSFFFKLKKFVTVSYVVLKILQSVRKCSKM